MKNASEQLGGKDEAGDRGALHPQGAVDPAFEGGNIRFRGEVATVGVNGLAQRLGVCFSLLAFDCERVKGGHEPSPMVARQRDYRALFQQGHSLGVALLFGNMPGREAVVVSYMAGGASDGAGSWLLRRPERRGPNALGELAPDPGMVGPDYVQSSANRFFQPVIPAEAGIQRLSCLKWIPASAGMTGNDGE